MPEGSARRSVLLVLGYIPLAGLLVLALEKRDSEVRWHARNGLLLFASVAAIGGVATLAAFLLPSLSCLYSLVLLFVLVAYSLITTLAIVKALEGQRLIVPGISRHAG